MKLPKPPETTAGAKAPRSLWDTVFTSTPVVMTVLATILAGLSSSEMSQSQYYRSLSAQSQSKAGDQWNFFQAKKTRGAVSSSLSEGTSNLGDVAPLTIESLEEGASGVMARLEPASQSAPGGHEAAERAGAARERLAALTSDADVRRALAISAGEPLPPVPQVKIADEAVRKAYEAIKSGKGDDDDTEPALFGAVSEKAVQQAIRASNENTAAGEDEIKPVTAGLEKVGRFLGQLGAAMSTRRAARSASQPTTGAASHEGTTKSAVPTTVAVATFGGSDRGSPQDLRQLAADFSVARSRFEAARQDREAKLNQQTAYLYEVKVRKASWESERHRVRSRYFFFGMLAAQAAVTIATLSLAVKERSWLWSVAATIGILALSYAGYVYLFT